MTVRIYYEDSRVTVFEAVVTACDRLAGRFGVRLDRTAFYPTSGGQPCDIGTLDAAAVFDVFEDDDGQVVHVVDTAIATGAVVTGRLDARRRVDHMEQHTGQHMLSAVLDRLCGAATVGFHMGAESSTIDLAREVTAEQIGAAEREVNRVIREDRGVVARIVPAGDVATLLLRRESKRAGPLRIVEVDGLDVSACGGTHVARTGEIGAVLVTGAEKVRGGTRLTFVCGGRAVAAARAAVTGLAEAGRLLGVGPSDVVARITQLRDGLRAADQERDLLRAAVAGYRAADWRASATAIGPFRAVVATDPAGPVALKGLAQAVVAEPGLLAVLIGAGRPASVVVARSADVGFDAGAFLRVVTGALGGRGGGRPDLAQGGVDAGPEDVEAFVRRTLAAWRSDGFGSGESDGA